MFGNKQIQMTHIYSSNTIIIALLRSQHVENSFSVQSGIRRLHSTVTYLTHVIYHWLHNIDNGLVTDVLFDIVNVNILLQHALVLDIAWKNFSGNRVTLSGRSQSVLLDYDISDPLISEQRSSTRITTSTQIVSTFYWSPLYYRHLQD